MGQMLAKNLHFLRYYYESAFFCDQMDLTFCDHFLPTFWGNFWQPQIWDIFPSGRIAVRFLAKNSKSGLFWGQKRSFDPRIQFLAGSSDFLVPSPQEIKNTKFLVFRTLHRSARTFWPPQARQFRDQKCKLEC